MFVMQLEKVCHLFAYRRFLRQMLVFSPTLISTVEIDTLLVKSPNKGGRCGTTMGLSPSDCCASGESEKSGQNRGQSLSPPSAFFLKPTNHCLVASAKKGNRFSGYFLSAVSINSFATSVCQLSEAIMATVV